MRTLILLFITLNILSLNAQELDWVDGDRFNELKTELLSKDYELFEALCVNKEIVWHWMNLYGVPQQLNKKIEHSLKMYQDEIDTHLRNSSKEKLT